MDRTKGIILLRGGLIAVASLLLVTVLLLSNLEAVAFADRHYQEQYRRLERPAATGMTEAELLRITGEIRSYLKGERRDLELAAVINNRSVPLFSQREREHMEDVRELFARGFQVRRGGVFFLGVLFFLGILVDRGRRPGYTIAHILNRAGLVALLGLGTAGLVLYFGFDYWFDVFHFLSFDNDLWLLEPSRHNLIKMFPQEFFYNTTISFGRRSLLQLVAMIAASGWYLRRERGKVQDDLRAGTGRIPYRPVRSSEPEKPDQNPT